MSSIQSGLRTLYIKKLPAFIKPKEAFEFFNGDLIVATGSLFSSEVKKRSILRDCCTLSVTTWEGQQSLLRRSREYKKSWIFLDLEFREFKNIHFFDGRASERDLETGSESKEGGRTGYSLFDKHRGRSFLTSQDLVEMGNGPILAGRAFQTRVVIRNQSNNSPERPEIVDATDLFVGELQASKWDNLAFVIYCEALGGMSFVSHDVAKNHSLDKSHANRTVAFSVLRKKKADGKFRMDVDFLHLRPERKG
jgi:hypothetical protein